MLLNEIWPDEDMDIIEATIRDRLGKAAMAGAIGAAGLLGGYGAARLIHNPSDVGSMGSPSAISTPLTHDSTAPGASDTQPSSVPTSPTDGKPPDNPARSNQVQAGGIPHPGYPPGLHSQTSAQRTERIRNFNDTLRPLIRQANSAVIADRSRLSRILSTSNRLSQEDQSWIADRASRYDVAQTLSNGRQKPTNDLIRELLTRIDIIPEDLAMAQAALETGWGTSDLARQGNNFFGQKATGRHRDDQRIRNVDGLDYRSYQNPSYSVQSYIHNLNTHPRYEEFRQTRARLRRQQGMTSQLMARELSKHLQAYSTNPRYMADLIKVMNSFRGL